MTARNKPNYYPSGSIFRAKVMRVSEGGAEMWDKDYGPYATASMAKSVSTQKLAWERKYRGTKYHVIIQRAELLWEDEVDYGTR